MKTRGWVYYERTVRFFKQRRIEITNLVS